VKEDRLELEGGLGTHLVLARLAEPTLDPEAVLKAAMHGVGGPPYPAKTEWDVSRYLRTSLQPLVREGAYELVDDEVMPLVVVR
jgi:hypothetical protein